MLYDFNDTRIVEPYPGVFVPQVRGPGLDWYGIRVNGSRFYSPILAGRVPKDVDFYAVPATMLEVCSKTTELEAQEVIRTAKLYAEALDKLMK